MEHIKKQPRVNLDLFDQHNSDTTSKPFMEGINIVILILLGCGGLYVYCQILFPKESSINFSGITTNVLSAKSEKKPVEKKVMPQTQFLVEGHREAGEKIKITIEGFDKKAWYTIDFGDGNTRTVTHENIAYSYKESGDYTLLLKVGHENEPVQRISKKIYIDEPIEVDSDAYFEK